MKKFTKNKNQCKKKAKNITQKSMYKQKAVQIEN